jgi:hypothetical protein
MFFYILGGGWDFVAHQDNSDAFQSLFSKDLPTFQSDASDSGLSYSRAGSYSPFLPFNQIMITVDTSDPYVANASSKLFVLTSGSAYIFNRNVSNICQAFSRNFDVRFGFRGSRAPGIVDQSQACNDTDFYLKLPTWPNSTVFFAVSSARQGCFWQGTWSIFRN